MAGLLLRLRLRLLTNTLRRGSQAAWGLALGGLFGLGAAVAVAIGLALAARNPGGGVVAVIAFGTAWVGWVLLPMLLFRSDDTLDPRKFALLPATPRQLVPGLLLAALVGVGGLSTLVGASGLVVGIWLAGGPLVAVLFTAVAVVVLLIACVATSRALIAFAADVLGSRRGRDVATLLTGLLAVAAFAAGQVLPRMGVDLVTLGGVYTATWVLRFTPGGLTGSAVAAAMRGDLPLALTRLSAVVLWCVLMLLAWAAAIRRTADRTPHRSTASASHGVVLYPRPLAWLPRNRTTAVAVRFLRGLARDPRVRNQSLSQAFILVPLVGLSLGLVAGPSAPLIAVYMVVPFGIIAANQLGLDGPALWLHDLAGADLRSDLYGRDLAVSLIGLPVAVVSALGLAAGFDAWAALPATLLLIVATLLALLGVSNLAAVLVPYPVPEDASNPFASGSDSMGVGCLQGIFAMLVLLVHGIVALPITLAAGLPSQPWTRLVAAVAALGYGAALLLGGTTLAVARARDRAPELLAVVDPRRR